MKFWKEETNKVSKIKIKGKGGSGGKKEEKKITYLNPAKTGTTPGSQTKLIMIKFI